MEVRDDAVTSRNRCLQAIKPGVDFDTQRSLWRAALKYGQLARMKREAADQINATSLTAADSGAARTQTVSGN